MNKILLSLVMIISLLNGASITETADSTSISHALTERDDYFVRLLGNFQRDGYPEKSVIRERLSRTVEKNPVWYNYLLGESATTEQQQNHYFNRAISATKSDIGKLWVLFLEFYKLGARDYQTAILDTLEHNALKNGIEVLPSIASQLQLLAQKEFDAEQFEKALFCMNSSRRFSRPDIGQEFITLSIPGNDADSYKVREFATEEFKNSWKIQSTFVKRAVDTVFHIALVVALLLFLILMLRYSASAIHGFVCVYPQGVSYKMRLFYTLLLIAISLALGVYPIVLLLTILIMRVPMKRSGTISVRVLLVMLLLYPSTMFIKSKLTYTISDDSPVSLYDQAIYNQPTGELYQKIKVLSESPDIQVEAKALSYTAMAIIQHKTGRTGNAVQLIRKAAEIWPEGEPVLMAAGNIYHAYGDSTRAFNAFQLAVDSFPESPKSNYNYGQINLEMVGITNGTDYINTAAERAPYMVNGFILKNASFFGGSRWPHLRQFFLGGLSPKQFWDNFEAFSQTPENDAKRFWGSSFLGLPILHTFIATILLLALSALIVPSFSQVKKNGHCVLCGKPVCKKCRINDICNECHAITHNITNESLVASLKIKLSDTKRVLILLKAHIADILFPGTRDLFLKKKSNIRTISLITITLLIYTAYSIIITIVPDTIPSLQTRYTLLLLIPGVLYNAFFFITNLRVIISDLKKRA